MTGTMSYSAGELILCHFPFSSGQQSKVRPGIVVLDTGDQDVLVARATSQKPRSTLDVPLLNWRAAGLLGPSVVRVDKLATVEKRLIVRRLGQLDPADRQNVAAVPARLFSHW